MKFHFPRLALSVTCLVAVLAPACQWIAGWEKGDLPALDGDQDAQLDNTVEPSDSEEPDDGFHEPVADNDAAADPSEEETPGICEGELCGVQAISSGANHTCALISGGEVKCWGANYSGQLGDGTTVDREIPVKVSGLPTGVVSIATGAYHTCALIDTGSVMCWGRNMAGQLGNSTTYDSFTPQYVGGLSSRVSAIAAGNSHTCSLLETGGLKCWGSNSRRQLGGGEPGINPTPQDVTGLASGVSAVAAGGEHTCALLSSGGLMCWGNNELGQAGNGEDYEYYVETPQDVSGLSSGVSAVAAGGEHTCALLSTGGVMCWGNNESSQLGNEEFRGHYATPQQVSGLEAGAIAIIAGGEHTCALMIDGSMKCWGSNSCGNLGDGTSTRQAEPVYVLELASGAAIITAGDRHTCAVLDNGCAQCWGCNQNGELGDGKSMYVTAPMGVRGLGESMERITAGGCHTCGISGAGGVVCWGCNHSGQLGSGTTMHGTGPVEASGLGAGVWAVFAGSNHTCALLAAGGAMCWGSNNDGQLGNGTTENSVVPVDVSGLATGVAQIAAGYVHTCALLETGGVMCWGWNNFGELGNGTTTDSPTPRGVVGLPSGAAAVTVGTDHTCALLSAGNVMCWGFGLWGQLGDGRSMNSSSPEDVSSLSGAVAVEAGSNHTCALVNSGGVKCWGINDYGQVGDGTTEKGTTAQDVSGLESAALAIAAGGNHACALLTSGGVQCWGSNTYGQLGDGTRDNSTTPVDVAGLESGIESIVAGEYHTCALLASGGMQCWGSDYAGQVSGPFPGYPHPVVCL